MVNSQIGTWYSHWKEWSSADWNDLENVHHTLSIKSQMQNNMHSKTAFLQNNSNNM